MTDKPIPFTREMAMAAWDGRKTQTRRVLKVQPRPGSELDPSHAAANKQGYFWFTGAQYIEAGFHPGDRLWVREPYWQRGHWAPIPGETTKRGAEKWGFVPGAEDEEKEIPPVFDQPTSFRRGLRRDGEVHWYQRLARFMPRAYSRQTAIVEAVKVERLQDIGEADAADEGVDSWRDSWTEKQAATFFLRGTEAREATSDGGIAQRLFYLLWNTINGPDAWAANPWVVAVTFKVVRANIDSPEAVR